jgi:hypothetical protein
VANGSTRYETTFRGTKSEIYMAYMASFTCVVVSYQCLGEENASDQGLVTGSTVMLETHQMIEKVVDKKIGNLTTSSYHPRLTLHGVVLDCDDHDLDLPHVDER